ncbi:MAG: NAD(+) synthase, partial [Clostridia bacterium]
YTEVSGIKKFIIGLSGGIDSAVSLFLLQKVVGKENIIAVNMPSKYNSEKTKTAAKKIAEKLGIRYEVIPIENIFNKQNEEISKVFPNCSDLNTENEQARIRGAVILAGVAARENAVFINNSNKTEIFLGYSTYLGDMNGCFCPLGDLLKYEVYDLGRFINERFGDPIPWNLFPDEYYQFNNETDIKPSAELKNNQVDPIKIKYHDAIIEQIMDYKKISVKTIKQWHKDGVLAEKLGIDPYLIEIYGMSNYSKFEKDIDWLYGLMKKNVWKRIQSPPVVVLSKTAFGFDLRESIL